MPHDPESRAEGEGSHLNDQAKPAFQAGQGSDGRNCRKEAQATEGDDDEPIGYGKPPRKHRFKPGHSGNPRGRSKGAKGMKSILRKEFSERVRITENGRTRTISKMELMVKRLAEKGAKGDFQSINKLLELGMAVLGMEDETSGVPSLTRQEQAIINQAVKRRRALAGKDPHRRKVPAANRKSKNTNNAMKREDL